MSSQPQDPEQAEDAAIASSSTPKPRTARQPRAPRSAAQVRAPKAGTETEASATAAKPKTPRAPRTTTRTTARRPVEAEAQGAAEKKARTRKSTASTAEERAVADEAKTQVRKAATTRTTAKPRTAAAEVEPSDRPQRARTVRAPKAAAGAALGKKSGAASAKPAAKSAPAAEAGAAVTAEQPVVAAAEVTVATAVAEPTDAELAAELEELTSLDELQQIEELEEAVQAVPEPVEAPAPKPRAPRKPKARPLVPATEAPPADAPVVLAIEGVAKSYGATRAVAGLDLEVRTGSFYGIVGPNGAGKTTTLSMVTGLLRPDAGSIRVHGVDVWGDPKQAKRIMGVLPDRLRLFDRLTGAQLLHYSGVLRGLDPDTVQSRSDDLVTAFGLNEAVDRLVADYSAGMTKKIALACAMIHSPRLLVLDEPFEAVDPVSAANLTEILQRYVAGGGTVVLSSHGMDLIERVCDSVAIIVQGKVLASGTLDEVRRGIRLEDRFVELAGGRKAAEGMEWLHSFSD